MKKSLLSLCLCLIAVSAPAREWTNDAGKKVQADFVELKGAEGSETVVLKLAGGRLYEMPLKKLSAADQAFAKSQPKGAADAAKPSAGKAAPAADQSVIRKALDGKLVALNGKRIAKYEMAEEPRYYAFYFSAHWCPPCRAFTPTLVEFYNGQKGKKKDFEIIFVSSDHDEGSMEEYIKGDSMPWPAINFRNAKKIKEVSRYAGNGIPCLVLVDREGKVVSHSYEGSNYVGPTKVMNDIAAKTSGGGESSNEESSGSEN